MVRRSEPVKQGPPFVDAMSRGVIIPLPCDISVRHGVLSWDWDHPALTVEAHPRSPVGFHVPAQVAGTPLLVRDHESGLEGVLTARLLRA